MDGMTAYIYIFTDLKSEYHNNPLPGLNLWRLAACALYPTGDSFITRLDAHVMTSTTSPLPDGS